MHSVNVFCQPVYPLSNVTQAGLFFSFLAKFVYFVHILKVHLKVSLPKISSQVCLPLQFESEFISVKYKACTKIHALHFSVHLWPLPVERTGRPSSSSHFDTCLCTLVCDMCVSMTCMAQRLCWSQRTTCKGWSSLPPSGGWGLNSDCSPLEASAFANWAISGS